MAKASRYTFPGSYYTQLISSICNHIARSYLQFTFYGRTFKTHVLGDDSEDMTYPNPVCFADILKDIRLTLHPEKTVIAHRPDEFLGHTVRGSRVEREDAELIALSLFKEYPQSSPAVSLTRIQGLLLDSGLNAWPMVNLFRLTQAKMLYPRRIFISRPNLAAQPVNLSIQFVLTAVSRSSTMYVHTR